MQINNSKLNKEPPITSKNLIKILDENPWMVRYQRKSDKNKENQYTTKGIH